ncbi:tail fiber domain-containing protein [Nitrospirillum sp. BR 11163]|uniref:tail fiber domain-containing protein n=1 Tax=Nitrospirillum sp. BR 11163 TaxID=3104323 RepID=UPI002AFEB50E|nr:tail fiber domain-containing protein [Nitrospirillum sp. BR 11163]MEA1676248.1 tail fiber domain-containing protein [Nitrospirillum sp. BR 11163]
MAKIYGLDSGSWGGNLVFATKTSTGSSAGAPVERMRLDNAGNLGVGTMAPSARLHVGAGAILVDNGSGDGTVRAGAITSEFTPGGNYINGADPQDGLRNMSLVAAGSGRPVILTLRNTYASQFWDIVMDAADSSKLKFAQINHQPTLTLTDSAVGIGTTAPVAKLDVAGNINAAGSVTQNSDMRLKTDVAALPDGALDQVLRLRPVTFRWKAPKDAEMEGRQTGLIAQETEAVLPDAVMTAKDKAGTKSIKYNEVMVTMLKALQEQQSLIQRQEKSLRDQQEIIRALQGRVEQLEARRP